MIQMAISGLYNMEIIQDLNTQWNRSKYTKLQKNLPNKKNDKVLTILVTNFIKIVSKIVTTTNWLTGN